jgi:aerobic carbon-monoxide dehydrogenase medium subunit
MVKNKWTTMHPFEYLEPTSLSEACRMLAERPGQARLLAGGTDLLIQMEAGKRRLEQVVSVGRIPGLDTIAWDARNGLTIGALVTLRQIELHPAVQERYPALQRGAAEVGSVQIRNLATLAGNVCNASPSADTSPALLALDATVRIAGTNGSREMAIGDFWTGPGRTALGPDEMLSAIHLPVPDPNARTFYYKLAVRKAMDLAMVGIAISLVPQNGSFSNARIALGAVGPVVLRATEAEQAITSGPVTPERIAEAAQLAMAASKPISDQRASAEYRREMVATLTRRGLQQLAV